MALWVNVSSAVAIHGHTNFIVCMKSYLYSGLYVFYYWSIDTLLQLLKWPSPPSPWQAGQPPHWVSPGQPATPSATPSLCPTPPKMAPSLSPNLPTVTPPTLWSPSNPAPLTGLRWRLWGRETEQTDRGQRSLGTLLQVKMNSKHRMYSYYLIIILCEVVCV